MKKEKISSAVIRRLPRYYRYLNDLHNNGTVRVSSEALARSMGLTASQIRQDLSCFGGFGQQGYGYNVERLRSEVADILGMNEQHTVVILGAGNLGRALIENFSFRASGFRLTAAFDIDPVAVKVSRENVKDNDVTNIECDVSDLLAGVKAGKYDVITANIVADIIIRMLPDISKFMHKDTVLILSGIIDERCQDVYDSIDKNSFEIVEEIHENGWCAISVKVA